MSGGKPLTLSVSKGSAVQFPSPCTETALARLATQKTNQTYLKFSVEFYITKPEKR